MTKDPIGTGMEIGGKGIERAKNIINDIADRIAGNPKARKEILETFDKQPF